MPLIRLKSAVGNDRPNDPSDVRLVAAALRSKGYLSPDEDLSHGYVTGPFVDAVQQFQGDKHLVPDGILTPGGPTEQALSGNPESVGSSKNAISPIGAAPGFRIEAPVGENFESRPVDVAKTKLALLDLGFLDPGASDSPAGLLDEASKDALKTYQAARRLRPDGWLKPGGETEDALDSDIEGRVQPANFHRVIQGFGRLGGRRIRDFVERNVSSLYYLLLREAQKANRTDDNLISGTGYRDSARPRPSVGRRGAGYAYRAEQSSEVDTPRSPRVVPADPSLQSRPQRGRPPKSPIKGDEQPPEPKDPPKVPDRETYPQPEIRWGDHILVLPEPDEGLRRPMIAKMRGNPRTRALDGGIGYKTLKSLPKLAKEFPGLTWEHVGGGFEARDSERRREKPIEKKQRYVPSIRQDEQEKRTTRDSSFPDFSIKITYRGVEFYVNINSQDTNADGLPTRREVLQIQRLNRNERGAAISIGVPKPARGEYLDPVAYQEYIEDVIRTVLKAINEDPEAAKRNPEKKIEYFRKVKRRDKRGNKSNDKKNK